MTPADRIAYLRRVAEKGGADQVRAALTEALDLLQAAEAERDKARSDYHAMRVLRDGGLLVLEQRTEELAQARADLESLRADIRARVGVT